MSSESNPTKFSNYKACTILIMLNYMSKCVIIILSIYPCS